MEGIQKGIAQHWGKAFVALIVLAIIVAYTSICSMDEEALELAFVSVFIIINPGKIKRV